MSPTVFFFLSVTFSKDLGQYAAQVSRKFHLTTEAQDELQDFSQLSGPQQSVWIAARMLDVNARMSSLIPAESVFHMPVALEGRIDQILFLALVDYLAPAYVAKANGPFTRVIINCQSQTFLEKHPSWGLTGVIMNDKSKFPVIKTRVRDKLTDYRNRVKVAIEESLGVARDPLEVVAPGEGIRKDALNIITLCQRIVAVGSKVAPDVKVSMEMAGCIAYLRYRYQAQFDKGKLMAPGFWEDVDSGLQEVREATKEVVEAMSAVFSRSLRDALALYGMVKLDHLATVPPTLLDYSELRVLRLGH
ncbi:hypothetical protein B0H17DRAFT_1261529 [Mycena rosella]|uniref:Uncharacterized protein n=1 Tax=Mycena rosella TaxID=1033263 RepID=A0AAD7CRC4_MYCRO|nr:hypothetical protein B0H17DRAFT_1261529 [Mycena rosella]